MDEIIEVDLLMGRIECRSWLEAEIIPDGCLRLVGMGSSTSFADDGTIVSHKCEATGAVRYIIRSEVQCLWNRI